ncbi:MAG: hypothetical protein ACP6IY_07480 [Promethearchaeia archaeon]
MKIKIVIDADCLNFLLNTEIGNKILKNCEIIIPPSILEELDQKLQTKLNGFQYKIEFLNDKDKEYAAKLISKISGKKEFKNWYLNGRFLKRIHNIGECEGAAIAKRLNIDIVLLDRKATSIIKQAFKFLRIKNIKLEDFGLEILKQVGNIDHINEFKEELKRRLHIFL